MTKMYEMIGLRLGIMLQGLSLQREEGQTLAEYAMILALIAILVVAAVLFLSGQISGLFSKVASQI